MIFGLFAWWLYDDSRAERSLLNAVVAAMFLAIGVYGIVGAVADAAVSKRARSRARCATSSASDRKPPPPAFTSRAWSS